MTDRTPPLLDDALIAAAIARRAPRGPDPALLDAIVGGTADVRQVRAWWRPVSPVRLRLLALAAVLVLGLVVAWLVSTLGSAPPRPALPTRPPGLPGIAVGPASNPADPSAAATPSVASCATETAVVAIGGDMPPAAENPQPMGAGVVGRSAYVTGPKDGTFVPVEVWSVRGGTSTRIAVVDGPGVNAVSVDDVSADGTLVVLAVGHISPSGASVECSDEYLLRSDGTSVTRLSAALPGDLFFAGRISPDNRYIAFVHQFTFDGTVRSGYVLYDRLATETPSSESVCNLAGPAGGIFWARTTDLFAAMCGRQIIFVNAGADVGSTDVGFDSGDAAVAGWLDDNRFLIGVPGPGDTDRYLDLWTLDAPRSPTNSPKAPRRINLAFDPIRGGANQAEISPDGRSAIVPTPASGDIAFGQVRLSDGRSSIITPGRADEETWSADGGSIVYVQFADSGPSLVVRDVATGDASLSRPLPMGFIQGVWTR